MNTKLFSCTFTGLNCQIVEVETDIASGMPNFSIVGLGDTSVQESKERIRSAIKNSGFSFPDTRKTVNLAPAEVRKQGSHFDLPIAIGLLICSQQVESVKLQNSLLLGELSLSGEIRAVSGVLAITQHAAAMGFKKIFVPAANALEASFTPNIEIYPLNSLKEFTTYLAGQSPISIHENRDPQSFTQSENRGALLSRIYGLEMAKRALQIAAAGKHNLLLKGPPGTGKTALGRAIIELMPSMSTNEILETTKIFSVAGLLDEQNPLITSRPFREVHHTASQVSLTGGGGIHPRPGEISLAHNGVLFLDEIAEFPRSSLEALRQPLEDRFIRLNRANFSLKFPSNFLLMATMNPCPCGYFGSQTKQCKCTESQINFYQQRISGPLLDRFDLFLDVEKVDLKDFLTAKTTQNSHQTLFDQIKRAISLQKKRFKKSTKINFNSEMDITLVRKHCALEPAAYPFIETATRKMHLSNRAYLRILKIARTIADLGGYPEIEIFHIGEALQFRQNGL